ncbi:sugar ABC transporter permease [Streptococcus pneumoniae]|nr:sugar ABC transporter permease [Streptococcus pneumoniae]
MEKQQPSKAALLSIIPGLGQIYNKQKAKGFIFLGVTIVFVLYFLALATPELSNLITLGDKPGRDNSLFMLIRGAFHLIFVIVYVLFISQISKMHIRLQNALTMEFQFHAHSKT